MLLCPGIARRSAWISWVVLTGFAPSISPTGVSAQGPAEKRARPPGGDAKAAGSAGASETDRPERYFAICDYDGDGMVSFKEAEKSLGLDREGFAAYDVDRDGLIRVGEFRRRYEAVTASGGAFLPPKGKVVPKSKLPSTPEAVLAVYDKVPDGALDSRELDQALVAMGASRFEAEGVLERLDRDGTDALERAEIEDLLELLRPGSAASRGPRPKSIDDLFGQIVPREIQEGSTPQPPRISGPVSSFRRLDFDADGRITAEDLLELQRPLSLPVRIAAVVAALDADRDGAISPAEFRASMVPAR